MNREDIIRMAREAGWVIHDDLPYLDVIQVQDALLDRIERIVNAATAAEREACLEIADQCADADMHASMAANAIRARGRK